MWIKMGKFGNTLLARACKYSVTLACAYQSFKLWQS